MPEYISLGDGVGDGLERIKTEDKRKPVEG
jgi:hypothetical protein